MGMIGGGKNAFIGAVHRIAANMDGLIELVCGAFSSTPDNARESGKAIVQYEIVIHQRPGFSQAHYRLARLYQKSGKKDLAREEFAILKTLR